MSGKSKRVKISDLKQGKTIFFADTENNKVVTMLTSSCSKWKNLLKLTYCKSRSFTTRRAAQRYLATYTLELDPVIHHYMRANLPNVDFDTLTESSFSEGGFKRDKIFLLSSKTHKSKMTSSNDSTIVLNLEK